MENILTQAALMEHLQISRTTLWEYRQLGMPCLQVRRKLWFRLADVMEWLQARRTAEIPAQQYAETTSTIDGGSPILECLIDPVARSNFQARACPPRARLRRVG